jgi:Uma2 family endonuclease
MATAPTLPFVPVEEYLRSSYEPDMEYVEGSLVERNVGDSTHSRVQALLIGLLLSREREYSIRVFSEQRIRVSERRYRVPDVCVMAVDHRRDRVFSEPPLLIIEILSPDDNLASVRRKVDDFRTMGVRNICIVDPYENPTVFVVTEDGRLVESASLDVCFVLHVDKPALEIDFGQVIAQI